MARRGAVFAVDFVIDDKSAYAAIRRMTTNVSDFRKFWPPVMDAILEGEGRYIESRGAGSWPELTPKYAKWKAAHGGGSLLELTGGLKASLTEKGAPRQKFTRGQKALTFASTWPTAHLHQKGKPRMPARPVIDAESPVMQKAIQDAFADIAHKWAADFGRGG